MALVHDDNGLEIDTFQEARERTAGTFQSRFGKNFDTGDSTINGQFIDNITEKEVTQQQILQQVRSSFSPNVATGVALDQIAALTGSLRKGALNSSVIIDVTFSAAGSVPVGTLFNDTSTGNQWESVSGPHNFAGPFPQTIQITFQSVDIGPIPGVRLTPWVPAGSLPGYDSASNDEDADLGRYQQSDPEFRRSRNIELFSRGGGGKAALRGSVNKVQGVEEVKVYHNPSINPVDSNGTRFKAFRVCVRTAPHPPPAALEQKIREAIFSRMQAGQEAQGTITGTVTNSQGDPETIGFELIDEVDVFIDCMLTRDFEQPLSQNIEEVIEAEILRIAELDHTESGRDVKAFDYAGIIYKLQESGEISGVKTVDVNVGRTSPASFGKHEPIGILELADFDSSRVNVYFPIA